jgi:hypothetical protein
MRMNYTETYRAKIMSLCDSLPPETASQVVLLRNREVHRWLQEDTTFLDPENPIIGYKKKQVKEENGLFKNGKQRLKTVEVVDESKPIYKYNTKTAMREEKSKNENDWNMRLLKTKRPDIFNKGHKQASLFGIFGEELVKEYFTLMDEYLTNKPESKNGHKLDLETIRNMVEVKTGSYFTTGTAGEKIYGTPWKYRNVPDLYGKPLLIVCVGGGGDRSDLVRLTDIRGEEQKTLWESWGITYVGFTSLLSKL